MKIARKREHQPQGSNQKSHAYALAATRNLPKVATATKGEVYELDL